LLIELLLLLISASFCIKLRNIKNKANDPKIFGKVKTGFHCLLMLLLASAESDFKNLIKANFGLVYYPASSITLIILYSLYNANSIQNSVKL